MLKVRQTDEYLIAEMIKSDVVINYDKFYKNELIRYAEVSRNMFKKSQKENKALKEKFRATNKGLQKVVLKRKKWKERYYKKKYENKELKEELEETDRKLFLTKNELDMRQKCIDNKLIQQQEFMKYLEDYIKEMEEEIGNSMTEPYKKSHTIRRNVYQEILQKYKEIVNGDDK